MGEAEEVQLIGEGGREAEEVQLIGEGSREADVEGQVPVPDETGICMSL